MSTFAPGLAGSRAPRAQTARLLLRALRARLSAQRAELGALCSALQPGAVAVDVGANKGSHAFWLARAVGRSGRLLACEPQAGLAEQLRADLQRLRWPQCDVRCLALGDRDGRATLHVPTELTHPPGATLAAHIWGSDAARAVAVPVARLDTLLADEDRPVRAIKIDVEGHEGAVLRGAQETLARHRPLLVIEIEARHLGGQPVEAVLAELRAVGYGGHFVRRGRLVPLAEFRVERDQDQAGPRFWERPDYCNNFILAPG